MRQSNQANQMMEEFLELIELQRTEMHRHIHGKPPTKKEAKKTETLDEIYHRLTKNKYK